MRTVFASLLLSLLLIACGIKEPELRGMKNLEVESLGINESRLEIELNYFNPNKSRLQFRSAEGEAWIENNPLGHFSIDTPLTLQPLTEFTLPLSLKMDMNKFLKNTTSLLLKKEVLVRIEGKARIGKSGVFINYPFRYEAKHDVIKLLRELKKDNSLPAVIQVPTP